VNVAELLRVAIVFFLICCILTFAYMEARRK
jgi:hypothetical protein